MPPHTWLTGQNVNLPGQCGSGLSAVVNLSKAIYQILVFVCSPRIGDAAKYVGCRSLGAQGRRPEGAAATAEMVEAALRGVGLGRARGSSADQESCCGRPALDDMYCVCG